MSLLKEMLEKALFDQTDESVGTPVSLRLPINVSNELDELSLTLDRAKSYLLLEFIKAGIKETNLILKAQSANPPPIAKRDPADLLDKKYFMLNTNYNNDKETHFEMLKNQEAAAFCVGWKEYICQLSPGDKVYLYQSGSGIIAAGTVEGDLLKSEHYGVAEDKYFKKLNDFNIGFKAISAKHFKEITGSGTNFRRTMIELTLKQGQIINKEIEKRMEKTQ